MKRIWIGAALLAALFAAGLWIGGVMEETHRSGARSLAQAAQLSLADEWDAAEALTAGARESWQKKRHMTAAVADHAPMDEIDALFAELESYAAARDAVSYSAGCARLSSLLTAMAESHAPEWWNFL